MDLKTYQGNSMAEALAKVKADLGNDAVILHTRSFRRGGVLGVGARTVVEITASTDAGRLPASERQALKSRAGAGRAIGRERPGEGLPGVDGSVAQAERIERAIRPSRAPGGTERSHGATVERPASASGSGQDLARFAASLHGEMNEIREMVRELLDRPTARQAASGVASGLPGVPDVPDELQEYYTRLLQNAVAEELAREVVSRARERLAECRDRIRAGVGDRVNEQTLDRRIQDKMSELVPAVLMESIERMLPPGGPVQIDVQEGSKVVALVGPTGVGKTTTIAKLAAHFKLREHRRVGLITTDTYRIAAVEQLRAYAEIMALPLEVVFTPEELSAAIGRLSGCDVIMIDTSGRSHRDHQRLDELHAFMDAARKAVAGQEPAEGSRRFEVHLLLACTGHHQQLLDVAQRFSVLGVDSVVFTKLDEAVGLGVVLNVASRLNCQMSYLTTGQDVPDDIEVGHRRRIAELLLAANPAEVWGRPMALQNPAVVDQIA